MKIDISTGSILLGDLSIGRDTVCDSLNAMQGRHRMELLVENAGWKTYGFEVDYYNVSLSFFDEKIRILNVFLKSARSAKSWSDWSYESEMSLKERHDEILLNAIGSPPYYYSWGTVQSIYDPKSATASIIVTYNSAA